MKVDEVDERGWKCMKGNESGWKCTKTDESGGKW